MNLRSKLSYTIYDPGDMFKGNHHIPPAEAL